MGMQNKQDGVYGMVPHEGMCESARKLRDTYAIKPGAAFYRREFEHYALERWYKEGLSKDAELAEVFDYDPPGNVELEGLGWCEGGFMPRFEEKHIEDRGPHEVIQDIAGRHILVFKGRRDGFMPMYLDHPVKDEKTWPEDVSLADYKYYRKRCVEMGG